MKEHFCESWPREIYDEILVYSDDDGWKVRSNAFGEYPLERIKYCPFCGIKLDTKEE